MNKNKMKTFKQDLSWVYNILEKKSETDRIIYENNHFILLPDIKWSGLINDTQSLYCLAITKDKTLLSMRDLRNEHIELLENIKCNTFKIIKQKYNINESAIRAYFHYPPSFYHLHIHFNVVNNNISGINVNHAYDLYNVIENLKIDGMYYEKIKLRIFDFQ